MPTMAKPTSMVHSYYHFTGKERDTETGLDYFGARYYASNMGRWMSPDWSATPTAVPFADLENPQSLNLYGYTENNPLSRTDPDGHFWQELWNKMNWGVWVNNAGLESALQSRGDAARSNISQMYGLTINGKSPAEAAKGMSNTEAITAQRSLVETFAQEVLANKDTKMMLFAVNLSAGLVDTVSAIRLNPFLASTGRTEAVTLEEQLAMKQVQRNPAAGQQVPVKGGMQDPRFSGQQGWVKMRQNVNGVEIHYVRNVNTGQVADFKFK